ALGMGSRLIDSKSKKRLDVSAVKMVLFQLPWVFLGLNAFKIGLLDVGKVDDVSGRIITQAWAFTVMLIGILTTLILKLLQYLALPWKRHSLFK
ncbi:MAG: hypothetical protein ACPGYJ_10190, partial [bacterium]